MGKAVDILLVLVLVAAVVFIGAVALTAMEPKTVTSTFTAPIADLKYHPAYATSVSVPITVGKITTISNSTIVHPERYTFQINTTQDGPQEVEVPLVTWLTVKIGDSIVVRQETGKTTGLRQYYYAGQPAKEGDQ